MHSLPIWLLLAGLSLCPLQALASLPENPSAFSHCTAKVKVPLARLRSGPSLTAEVVGTRFQDQPLYVIRVCGKWVEVSLESGETAYVAAYLLAFPYHELLEQWKRSNPSPAGGGKKSKVKLAKSGLPLPSIS